MHYLLCIRCYIFFTESVYFNHSCIGDEPKDEKSMVDRTSLKTLTDMGFPESKAIESLKQNWYVSI